MLEDMKREYSKSLDEKAGRFFAASNCLTDVLCETDKLFDDMKVLNNSELEHYIAMYYQLRESVDKMKALLEHMGDIHKKTEPYVEPESVAELFK